METVTLSAVTACAPAPDASHTVDYYRAHASERQTLLARCANDPGGVGQQPDCTNAREADRIEGIGSLRALPPLGLPAKPSAAPGR